MNEEIFSRSVALMGTVVTVRVVGHGGDSKEAAHREETVGRAFEWFRRIEECCTRFEEQSEVMQLAARAGVAVPVSTILYEAVQFALALAEESGGAFDPTVGYEMERRGFNEEYRTRRIIRTSIDPGGSVSYRDVRLNPERKTIRLLRPLILDLGAVAKGLAIDMAARELRPLENFMIDAGGDLYLGGHNPKSEPWSIGIRHPRRANELIDTLRVSDGAVCTSGDYERTASTKNRAEDRAGNATGDSATDGGHHILDPRTGVSPNAVASVTVVAPTAMLADGAATAAFVLGPSEGIQLLERLGVDGLMITPTLERCATQGMCTASVC